MCRWCRRWRRCGPSVGRRSSTNWRQNGQKWWPNWARLIPTALAEQAITGSDEKVETNQEVRITVVTKAEGDPALPAREVEGEVITHDESVGNVH